MNATRPILILTASAGAGHTLAARALEQVLNRLAPGVAVEVHDILQHTSGFFRRLYAQGYLGLVNYAPTAMGLLYDAMDRPNQRIRDACRTAFQNVSARRAMRLIQRRRPGLIINTHFLPAEIVAQMRRRGTLDVPQVTVTTDFETHRLWAQQPTERYYTATEEGKAYLATWGVPRESIVVSGIPVRPEFEAQVGLAEARSRLGLDGDRPVVLLLCGGFGVGPIEGLLRELARVSGAPQVVVITGRNERLRQRLVGLAVRDASRVRVLGFTDEMHLWMRAADLVVTKPGGLTVAEALVCGLPMVIVNPIPGQEARNSDFLLEHGAAIKVNNQRLLGHRVQSLLSDPRRLSQLREAARRTARAGAAQRIARDALSLAGVAPASVSAAEPELVGR